MMLYGWLVAIPAITWWAISLYLGPAWATAILAGAIIVLGLIIWLARILVLRAWAEELQRRAEWREAARSTERRQRDSDNP